MSVYANVSRLLEQMEEVASEGKSPTGFGPPMTPLPPESAASALGPMRALRVRLRQAAESLASAELAALETREGLHSTLLWLSNLAGQVRNAVDDLQPSRMKRYGAVEGEQRQALENAHTEMRRHLAQAREALEEE